MPARAAQIRIPTSVTCEACSGSGAKAGTKPKDLPDVRRPGQSPPRPGLLHARAHLPELPGPRPVDRQPLRVVRRLRPRHARADVVGEHPGRRRRRHPHPARRRRRGRRARRPAGRSLYFPVDRRASVLPARRRRPALPRAGLDGDGGDGRRFRGADDRRRQDQGEGAGGHPIGPAFPACRARACRCCARGKVATCMCRSWSRRRKN